MPADEFSETASISDDGRFVAFVSFESALAPGEANGKEDVFVRDRLLGLTERVAPGATQGCRSPVISGDGRYVAFVTASTNLVVEDTHGEEQVLLFDRVTGLVELISKGPTGQGGNQGANFPSISTDGRFVSFQSYSNDLFVPDLNSTADIFMMDRQTGLLDLISLGNGGIQTDEHGYSSALTNDGRYVVFETRGDNIELVPNGYRDVFRRDRLLGITEKVSFNYLGTSTHGRSEGPLDISADGRWISFHSEADDLVPFQQQDMYPVRAVFVRDMELGVTELISQDSASPSGAELGDSHGASMSADGRFVAFTSEENGAVYLRDRETQTTLRADHGSLGQAGNQAAFEAALSNDGRLLAFTSLADNLIHGDTNQSREVFAREFHFQGGLQVRGLVAGSPTTVTATGLVPGTVLLLGASVSGPGPLPSPFGLINLGSLNGLFVLSADATGSVTMSATLPPTLLGVPLWLQGVDLFSGLLTPAFGCVVQ